MQAITDFLKQHPEANRTDITSATNIKGLHFFSTLKKMGRKGSIRSEEVDGEMTYSLVNDDEEKRSNGLQKNEDEQKNETSDITLFAGRDHSKFKFNSELYGKSRLVLAVVKQYMEDNLDTTYKQLKEAFPDALMKRFGVFANLSDAEDQKAMKKRSFTL